MPTSSGSNVYKAAVSIVLGIAGVPTLAHAQSTFPARPLRIVVSTTAEKKGTHPFWGKRGRTPFRRTP